MASTSAAAAQPQSPVKARLRLRRCGPRSGLSKSTRRQLCHSVPPDIGIYHRRKPQIARHACRGGIWDSNACAALMCRSAAVGPRDGSQKPKLHRPPVFLQRLPTSNFSLRRHASLGNSQRTNRPVARRVLDSMTAAACKYTKRFSYSKGAAEDSSVKQQFRSG